MYAVLSLIFFSCLMHGSENLIVPDEVPSVLSLIYSNIPPIRKGTDSRLGWGFRLGDHADFQILVELGPQTNTKPLGNEGNDNNKRNAPNSLRNILYAQNQLLKKQQQQQKQQISDTDGGKWLQTWSSMMSQNAPAQAPVEGAGEIDASLAIPPELEELYLPASRNAKQLHSTTTKNVPSTTSVKTTTDPKDAIDNVDLE